MIRRSMVLPRPLLDSSYKYKKINRTKKHDGCWGCKNIGFLTVIKEIGLLQLRKHMEEPCNALFPSPIVS